MQTTTKATALTEKQRLALISLLADDDPDVYRLIRSKLLSYGTEAEAWLQQEALSSNPIMRRRAREILLLRARERTHAQFVDYCRRQGDNLDLEEATLLLAKTRYPHINKDAYGALLDSWAQEASSRSGNSTSSNSRLSRFNQYMFGDLGFAGHENYSSNPESCYLNTIIDKRLGNPIGLCTVYLLVARRIGMPIAGIGLPGHFICRFQTPQSELYVDCFRSGALLAKADCTNYLMQTGCGMIEGQLSPVSSKYILQRMCRNLVTTFGHLEESEEATRAQMYLTTLSR